MSWSSTSNTRIVMEDQGIVLIVANNKWVASAGGSFRTVQIFVNDVNVAATTVGILGGVGTPQASVSFMASLEAGDHVTLYSNQDTGAALNVTSAQLSVAYLGLAG